MTAAELAIVQALAKANQGVSFSSRYGAVCPVCGTPKMRITVTKQWADGIRVRFHRCSNTLCILNSIGASIKSIQQEE